MTHEGDGPFCGFNRSYCCLACLSASTLVHAAIPQFHRHVGPTRENAPACEKLRGYLALGAYQPNESTTPPATLRQLSKVTVGQGRVEPRSRKRHKTRGVACTPAPAATDVTQPNPHGDDDGRGQVQVPGARASAAGRRRGRRRAAPPHLQPLQVVRAVFLFPLCSSVAAAHGAN
jgi:hypothetical protein